MVFCNNRNSVIKQKLYIPYKRDIKIVHSYLRTLFAEVIYLNDGVIEVIISKQFLDKSFIEALEGSW